MVGTSFACVRSYPKDNNLQRSCRITEHITGQHQFGSAALDLGLAAGAQVDAFWGQQELNLYDIAAGALIATEAGATITDFREWCFPKANYGNEWQDSWIIITAHVNNE
jgi:myo-inositol-1(or 4)-monophosphatase